MKKITAFGFSCFLFFSLSCQERKNEIHEVNARGDSLTAGKEEFQENEQGPVKKNLTYIQKKGKRIYDRYCAVCHGAEGKGDGFNSYNINPRPKDLTDQSFLTTVTDTWLMEAINQGGRGVKRSVLMPSYEKTLSKEQVEAIVKYIHALGEQ